MIRCVLALALAASIFGPGVASAAPTDGARLVWSGAPDGGHALDDELSVEERKAIQERLKVRRKMADAHQALAFATTGLILATEVLGLVNVVALQTGEPRYRELKPSLATHRVLAAGSVGTYLASGVLAWTMPRAYRAQAAAERGASGKADSGAIHVGLSVAHGIGMASMVATGLLLANVADNDAWEPLAFTHATVGFTTAALVLAGAIVITTL